MIFEMMAEERRQFILPNKILILFDRFRDASPEIIARNWQPIEVDVITKENGRDLAKADIYVGLNSPRPIFNEAAIEVLGDILIENGELLPLTVSAGPKLYIHNTKVVDGLDYARSEIRRFKSGKVMMVRHPVFKISAVHGRQVFVLPAGNLRPFVSDNFRELVQRGKLTGVVFHRCSLSEDYSGNYIQQ